MAYTELTTNDTQDFYYLFKYINDSATGGLFFPVILGMLWVIFFILSLSNGRQASRAWIFSSFVCVILSILLGIMGFLNPNYIYFLVILLAFGVVWSRFENAPD